MITENKGRLSRLLSDCGVFSDEQVRELITRQQENGAPISDVVVQSGYAEEGPFLSALAEQMKIPFVKLSELDIDPEVLRMLPAKAVYQYSVIPIAAEGGSIRVATRDPFHAGLTEALRLASGKRIRFALCPLKDIDEASKNYYGVGGETIEKILQDDRIELADEDDFLGATDIESGDEDATIVRFVNQIIWEAHQTRATDIHMEPMEKDLRIRYRVDGVLLQTPVPAELKRLQSAIIARIKVMANMDIAERRLPQDGRISVRIKGEEIDIRVSTMPTTYGESVSLRLLTRGTAFLGLGKLGLAERDERELEKLIHKPHGIILVTGPTGSGKSTSLYAYLHTINTVDKRLITIEDPIEYEMPGVNQINVKSEIGLTFALGLRHILRQDPDVIMVGEIRDSETADIAIQAALTGHLVFSTLHTNDAAGGVSRLLEMGIEPFLVASSIEAMIAQRLVRRLCNECKVPLELDEEYLKKAGFPKNRLNEGTPYRSIGCEACRNTGFSGRTGIYEVMVVNDNIRPMIIARASANQIKSEALKNGMRTLRDDGWSKVLDGVTTIGEVLRVSDDAEEEQAGEEFVGLTAEDGHLPAPDLQDGGQSALFTTPKAESDPEPEPPPSNASD